MVFKFAKGGCESHLRRFPGMSSTIQLSNRLKWLPFHEESKINKAVFAFKIVNGETARYLRESLK